MGIINRITTAVTRGWQPDIPEAGRPVPETAITEAQADAQAQADMHAAGAWPSEELTADARALVDAGQGDPSTVTVYDAIEDDPHWDIGRDAASWYADVNDPSVVADTPTDARNELAQPEAASQPQDIEINPGRVWMPQLGPAGQWVSEARAVESAREEAADRGMSLVEYGRHLEAEAGEEVWWLGAAEDEAEALDNSGEPPAEWYDQNSADQLGMTLDDYQAQPQSYVDSTERAEELAHAEDSIRVEEGIGDLREEYGTQQILSQRAADEVDQWIAPMPRQEFEQLRATEAEAAQEGVDGSPKGVTAEQEDIDTASDWQTSYDAAEAEMAAYYDTVADRGADVGAEL